MIEEDTKTKERNSGSEKRECDKDRKGDTMRESQSINVCGDRSSVRPRSSQCQRNTTFTTLARCSVAPDFSPLQLFSVLYVYPHFFSIFLYLASTRSWLLRCLNSSVIQVNWLLSRLVTFKPRAIDIPNALFHCICHSVTCYGICHHLRPIIDVACAAPPVHLAHHSVLKCP